LHERLNTGALGHFDGLAVFRLRILELARLEAAATASLDLRLNQSNYDHDITCTYTSEMDPFYHMTFSNLGCFFSKMGTQNTNSARLLVTQVFAEFYWRYVPALPH
jgi:hypothetical protein